MEEVDKLIFELYPPELSSRSRFFSRNRYSSPYYLELFCRHFYCCVLLANTVLEQSEWVEQILAAQRETDDLSESEEEGSMVEDEELFLEEGEQPEPNYDPDPWTTVYKQVKYEFVLLECGDESFFVQNKYLSAFLQETGFSDQTSGLDRLFDLVWIKGKKLIEVKVSSNVMERRRNFVEYVSKLEPHIREKCALIALQSDGEGSVTYNIEKEDIPGYDSACSFLKNRFRMFADRGITNEEFEMAPPFNFREGTISNNIVSEFLLFKETQRIIKELKISNDQVSMPMTKSELKNAINSQKVKPMEQIMPSDISNVMYDLHNINQGEPEVKINATTIPHFYCNSLEFSEDTTDKEMLKEVCTTLSKNVIFDGEEEFVSLSEVLTEVSSGRFSKNSTPNVLAANGPRFIAKIQCQSYKAFPFLSKSLGVGAKKKKKSRVLQNGMQQKAHPERKMGRFPSFIYKLIHDMEQKSDYKPIPSEFNDWPQSCRLHPFDNGSISTCNHLQKWLDEHNVAIEKGIQQRIFSQIAGTIVDGMAERTSLSCFTIHPLTLRVNNGVKNVRLCWGLVVRGPNHSKSSNDRIPLFVIQMVPSMSKKLIQDHFKGFLYGNSENKDWGIACRKTSVSKESLSYKMFLENVYLLPASTIQNIATSLAATKTTVGREDWFEAVSASFLENQELVLERCIESLLVALYSTPQYEGVIAILRKIILLCHVWKLEKPLTRADSKVYHKNVVSLVEDKLNPLLIDDPVAFYFYDEVYSVLCSYRPGFGFGFL